MTAVTLTFLEGQDPRLYGLIGPFAMDRAVVKELGGPVFTSLRHLWVVAQRDAEVVGWSGLDLSRDGIAALDWSYVAPQHRRCGLRTQMVGVLEAIAGDRVLLASTARDFLKDWYIRHGFQEIRRNGAWTHYRREPPWDSPRSKT